jgi:hypothetical protein
VELFSVLFADFWRKVNSSLLVGFNGHVSRFCGLSDILRAVNGAASLTAGRRKRWELMFAHRRVQGVPRPRYS